MKRLGPAAVLAATALSALYGLAETMEFTGTWIPQQVGSNSIKVFGGVALGLSLMGTVAGGVAFVLGAYDVARVVGVVCTVTGILSIFLLRLASPEQQFDPNPLISDLVVLGVIAAGLGWWLVRVSDRRLEAIHRVHAASADAIRFENRKRGVTLPAAPDADSQGGDPTPAR